LIALLPYLEKENRNMKSKNEKDKIEEKAFMTSVGLKRFGQWKKTALGKTDLSRKGSIDEALIPWVTLINEYPLTYTTSCCSGRIAIIEQPGAAEIKKEGLEWIHMSHIPITDFDEIKNKIKNRIKSNTNSKSTIYFKFEGCIAHFCVENLKLGKKLFDLSRQVGFRNSGISIGANAKFTIQIRGTNSLEVPLSNGDTLLGTGHVYYSITIQEL